MAKVARNGPCPCGSRKKAKRCCFSSERLAADARVRITFKELRDAAEEVLGTLEREELPELVDEVMHLPELDLSLQLQPGALSPVLERAREALGRGDAQRFVDAVHDLAGQVGTLERRLELARAVVALRDAGRVDAQVAAVALFDLGRGTRSALLAASLAQSIRVSSGHVRTPAGLAVVA